MKFLRRLRKKIGVYTRHDIETTYANALQHGRKMPEDVGVEEMVKMMQDWIKAINRH